MLNDLIFTLIPLISSFELRKKVKSMCISLVLGMLQFGNTLKFYQIFFLGKYALKYFQIFFFLENMLSKKKEVSNIA